jgi:hypothetical protein
MSDYRDDSQDTAIASDRTFGGLRAAVDEVLRVSDALLFGIAITLSSQAIASDEVIDSSVQVLSDSALISDSVTDSKLASQLHSDSAKISDSTKYSLFVVVDDSASISDYLPAGVVTALSVDSAVIADSITDRRNVVSVVSDSAKASDNLTAIIKDMADDSAGATDSVTDKLRAVQMIGEQVAVVDEMVSTTAYLVEDSTRASDDVIAQRSVSTLSIDNLSIVDDLLFSRADIIDDSATISDHSAGKWIARGVLIDSAVISDSVIDSIVQNTVIIDSIAISDEVIDKLDARVLIIDGAVIEDITLNSGGLQGQAWTANVDSWAMSRYNPYNYNRLVVINDVLYGEADDGIYRLDQEVSAVTAIVKTGKMDLGRGQLTHPSSAYLEYELSGGASMTVSSTQKGVGQQYTYMLPNEVADELTNGRFIFGRGLRGRHFAFELIMIGTHGHINDLSIEHMPTSRRV